LATFRRLRLCSYDNIDIDLEQSVKIDLCGFKKMNIVFFLVDLDNRVKEFENKFCEI